jgi:ABC-type branched-subunit amino acid transport system substrate-binding protein
VEIRHRSLVALLAALAMLLTACGTRLNEQERADLITAMKSGGGSGAGPGTVDGTGPTSSDPGDTPTNGGTGGGGTNGGGSDNGGQEGGPAADTGEVIGGIRLAACADATKTTDTGATANKVTVATLADISGVQPGLFQSAHQAARAATAYINSQGGICGRQLEVLPLDSKTDSGGNRAAMLDACSKAFAVVGSISAFDDGSAAPGRECGIPDISAITTNAAKFNSPNVFPIFPNGGPLATTPAKAIAKRFPDVIKKAAIIWLNQAVTKNNAVARQKAWQSVGYNFIYQQEVQVLEANYTRFVIEMQNRDVQYVTMVSDFQSVVRLQKSMRQQNYIPKVRDWDSVAYDPDYLDEPTVVEGSLVFLSTALFEEAASNPEMRLYADWLKRGSPGAVPDYFGIHTWSAFRLFQVLANNIGGDLTRAKMLAALKATKTWNGNGLHVAHQTGAKLPSLCSLHVQVKGGKFARLAPASGFNCDGSLFRP